MKIVAICIGYEEANNVIERHQFLKNFSRSIRIMSNYMSEGISELYRRVQDLRTQSMRNPDGAIDAISDALEELEVRIEEFSSLAKRLCEKDDASGENKNFPYGIQGEKDRLSAVLNSIDDEIWFTDAQGKVALANLSALREFALGFDEEQDAEKIALSLDMTGSNGCQKPVEAASQIRALRGEVVRNQEETIKNPVTGELEYRQINSTPMKDARGDIIGAVSIVHDITERKNIEIRLKQSESRYRTLFKHSPIPTWEENLSEVKFRIDIIRSSGVSNLREYLHSHPRELAGLISAVKVLDINQKGKEFFKISSQEAIPSSLSDYYSISSSELFIEELVSLSNGSSSFESEASIQTKAGDRKIVSLNFSVVPGYENTLSRVLVSIIDITERKASEQEIQRSESRYRLLTENMKDIVWIMDPKTLYFQYISPSVKQLLGYTAEEVMARPADVLIPKTIDYIKRINQDRICRFLAGDGSIEYYTDAMELPCKDGSSIWTEVVSRIYRNMETGDIEVHGVTRDATKRRRFEEQIISQRDLAIALVEAASLNDALKACLHAALKVSGMDCGGIYLLDRSGDLRLAYAEGLSKDFLDRSSHYGPGSDQGSIVMSGVPLYSRYDCMDISIQDDNQLEGLLAMAMIPIFHGSAIIGCFNIASHSLDTVPDFSRNALEAITAQVGNAIVRLQAEEALRESQVELQDTFDSIQDFLFILDSDGRILRANKTVLKRLGYSENELRGMNVLDIHPPESRRLAGEIVADMIAGRRDVCPIPILAKDGTRIPVETKVTLERWGCGDVIIGISRDVSERMRIEDALRKSEARYRAVVEDQTELICRFTPEGIISFVNGAICRYAAMSNEEFLGQSIFALMPPGDRSFIEKKLQLLSQRSPIRTFRYSTLEPGKGIIWQEWTVRALFDDQRRLTEYMAVGRDITERRMAEDERERLLSELTLEKSRWQAAVDNMLDYVITCDSKGQVNYVNPAYQQMLGRKIIKDMPMELDPDYYQIRTTDGALFAPEDLPLQKAALTGMDVRNIEILHLSAGHSGHIAIFNAAPIFDSAGRVTGAVAVGHDITEQRHMEEELRRCKDELEVRVLNRTTDLKKANEELQSEISDRKIAEERLTESEDQLRRIADNMLDMVASIDKDGRFIYLTPSYIDIMGYEMDELLGTYFLDRIHTDDTELVKAAYDTAIRTKLPGNVEYRSRHKDGRYIWLETVGKALLDDAGRINGLILSTRDITMRKMAEDKLMASIGEKELLIREVHHRIKNNLQIASSLLYLLSKKVDDGPAREMFQASQNRIKTIALVHEKLLKSQSSAKIQFGEYVNDLIAQLSQSYNLKSIGISIRSDLDKVMLNMETAVPCGLIINELITNSIKHAFPDGRKGEIWIGLRLEGPGRFKLILSDDGVGLGEAKLDMQTLGMQLVSTLVKQIEGKLSISSEHGARFEVDFKELRYKERFA